MTRPAPDLSRLFRPASIAFVGGAQMEGPIRACRRAGYAGEIWAVNPARAEIGGVACVAGVEDLAAAPDAALVGLAPEKAEAAVRALAARGAGGAVVMSAGYAETGPAGRARQAALVAAAGPMPLLGPNCMGLLNLYEGAAVWGDDTPMARPAGPGAAIISQSGALLIGIVGVERAFPLGYAVSTGNQAAVEIAACIHAVLADDRVRAIGLYLEGLADGAALGAACLAARARGVPVVALKGGDRAEGAAMALSHTAAMVMARDVWDAFRRRFGVAEASSPKALVEALKLLAIGGIPAGRRAAFVTYSGGANGLIAARAARMGLTLPPPGDAAALRAMLPDTVAVANPLDLNIPFRAARGVSMQDAGAVAEAAALLGRGADQLAFLMDAPRPGPGDPDRIWTDSLARMPEVGPRIGAPVAVAGILPEGLPEAFREEMQRAGVPALLGLSETLEAMAIAAELSAPPDAAAGPLCQGGELAAAETLDEDAGKARLAAFGLAAPPRLVAPVHGAGAAAARLGGPVAVKALSARLTHKAQAGGVRLNLSTPAAAQAAAFAIARDVAPALDGAPLARVLVERMIEDPAAEIIIGVKRDRAVGLVLMIGRGGAAAEAEARFETVLLPPAAGAVEGALAALGFAGRPALARAAEAVIAYALAEAARLVTLDVNPVILTRGGAALAADAVIVLGPGPGGAAPGDA